MVNSFLHYIRLKMFMKEPHTALFIQILNVIHEENDVIKMGELTNVKKKLKQYKHTCLIMRMEHPRAYEIH